MGAAPSSTACCGPRKTATRWMTDEPPDEEAVDEAKSLQKTLDVDALRQAFIRFAGPDECMDPEEYDRFAAALQLGELKERLWTLMDGDNSGSVSKREFTASLQVLQQARAWMRFCPTCAFDNNCAFCKKCASCPSCSNVVFCPACWADHPEAGDWKATDKWGDGGYKMSRWKGMRAQRIIASNGTLPASARQTKLQLK